MRRETRKSRQSRVRALFDSLAWTRAHTRICDEPLCVTHGRFHVPPSHHERVLNRLGIDPWAPTGVTESPTFAGRSLV